MLSINPSKIVFGIGFEELFWKWGGNFEELKKQYWEKVIWEIWWESNGDPGRIIFNESFGIPYEGFLMASQKILLKVSQEFHQIFHWEFTGDYPKKCLGFSLEVLPLPLARVFSKVHPAVDTWVPPKVPFVFPARFSCDISPEVFWDLPPEFQLGLHPGFFQIFFVRFITSSFNVVQ